MKSGEELIVFFCKGSWKCILKIMVSKLILFLIFPFNFLFHPFLPKTMGKCTLREIWLCFERLIMEPNGTYKKDLFFQCIFGHWTKLCKCRVSNKFKTLRAEGNATSSEILAFSLAFGEILILWRLFNVCMTKPFW